jgi:hypothetical protein
MNVRCGIVLLAAQLIPVPSAFSQDHLEPEAGILNALDSELDYAKSIRGVLLKGAAGYYLARMVCLPSFETEWVVTVVREDAEDQDDPQTYYVEYVGAQSMIHQSKDPEGVKVRKARAALDSDTAELLNKTWHRMLQRTRYPKNPEPGADGVSYHFSRFVPLINRGMGDPDAGWEQGKTWSPDEDSLCGEMVAIGEALKDFALTKPGDRKRSGLLIRDRTLRLKVKLDRSARNERARPGGNGDVARIGS